MTEVMNIQSLQLGDTVKVPFGGQEMTGTVSFIGWKYGYGNKFYKLNKVRVCVEVKGRDAMQPSVIVYLTDIIEIL